MSFSTLSVAVISRPAWKRSPYAVGLFQSALRPAQNRKSILTCSSESGAAIIGTMLRTRSIEEKADATRRFAAAVLPLVSRGRIRPVIDRVYPIDQVRDAHERLESNPSFGKIVLTFA